MPSENQEQIDHEQAEAEKRVSERRQDEERLVIDTALSQSRAPAPAKTTMLDRRSMLTLGLAIVLLSVVIGYLV